MSRLAVIGIDPGGSGGIAILAIREGGGREAAAWKMPTTDKDLWDLLHSQILDRRLRGLEVFGYIEKVWGMPNDAPNAAFKFGQHYGMLRGYLISMAVPFELVAPGVWQRKLGCLSGGNKNVTKARAQELFPGLKIIHAIADALLIAEYGWRQRAVVG